MKRFEVVADFEEVARKNNTLKMFFRDSPSADGLAWVVWIDDTPHPFASRFDAYNYYDASPEAAADDCPAKIGVEASIRHMQELEQEIK